MSFEGDFRALIASLVDGRAYPDVPPDVPVYPFITYQQVGGQAGWFLDQSMPDKKHARMQVNVWAATRVQANTIGRQVEAAISAGTMQATPIGALQAEYESDLKKYGTRQDFGVWYPDP